MIRPPLDLEALAMLVAVVDAGSFTAAAARLGRSQSAVSLRIAELERRVSHRLLERDRRGVRLTDAGERLVGHARRMLAIADAAMVEMGGPAASGRVRLGIPDDYLDAFLQPLISRFVLAHPRVELEVRCELSYRLEALVGAGELDVAVVTRDAARPLGELLRREPVLWVAARGHRPELQEVLPLALFPEGCRCRPDILDALNRVGRAWRVAYTSSSTQGILLAVRTGLGVTALVESAIPAEQLRIIGEAEGLPPLHDVGIGLLTAKAAPLAARRLASHLREQLAPASVAA
ncbi:LysR substrate-binding domain-containing protein [Chelatococcus sp. SYSU_G07232]|uniref:LysR substrate-binding domain-containing protein n=1 Tax=Chelatococcus albus TaxID=3047466 RepID=A0ABT7ANQ3_9HYPH|nr:LysR substrate-binding domain-containing protein [Chelatococcus sp. SYSU_G07232]MDJ1160196.1 LysR substrate-binding domain-containing protein [Chelatococcus sp. SYSU_G07232]